MTIAGLTIASARFFSTHHASAGDALAARTRPFTHPTYPLLVARARRFTSLVTQLHMEVCGAVTSDVVAASEAEPPLASAAHMPAVFATCHGEIQTAEVLISDLFTSAVVSSARFALSVHNAAAGLYSVATTSMEPSTTVTGVNAIAAGWIEAALIALDTGKATLLSIADEPVPDALQGPRSVLGVAAAFVLAPSTTGRSGFELDITPAPSVLREFPGSAGGAALSTRESGGGWLASGASGHDAAPEPLHTLASVVDATERGMATTVPLGPIRSGHVLELRWRPVT